MVTSCRFGLQVIFHEEGFLSMKTAAIAVRAVPKTLIIAVKVRIAGYVIDTFSCNKRFKFLRAILTEIFFKTIRGPLMLKCHKFIFILTLFDGFKMNY